MIQYTVPRVGSKALLYCLPGYLTYPSIFPVLLHIFSWIFLWGPCFWFLWVILVPYLIGQHLLVSWWGEIYLPLPCSFKPRTAIRTLSSFENPLIVLVLDPEHCANFWKTSLEGVRDSWLFFLVAFLYLSPLLALYVPIMVWLLMFS